MKETKHPLISIIVPVYNVEDYVDQCIKSILSQETENYELILVDDGSTDNSGQIVDKYNDLERIHIIHKENGGLSDARNCGLSISTGEYIMFIDSDDFLVDSLCISKITESIKSYNPDVVQYKKVYYYNDANIKYDKDLPVGYTENVPKLLTELNSSGLVSVAACDKVVKASIIKDHKIYFQKDLLNEDILWSYNLYQHVNNICTINENIYSYRQARAGSISSKANKRSFDSLYMVVKHWYTYSYSDSTYQNLYYNLISYWYLILRTKYSRDLYEKEHLAFFAEHDKEMLTYNINYKVKKAYNLSRIIGVEGTIHAMRLYLYLKNKGMLKL